MGKKKRGLVRQEEELIILRKRFMAAHRTGDFQKIDFAMEQYCTRTEVFERHYPGEQTMPLLFASSYALLKGAIRQSQRDPRNPMNLYALQQASIDFSSQGVLLVDVAEQGRLAVLLARSLRSFLATPYAPLEGDEGRTIGWDSLRESYEILTQRVLTRGTTEWGGGRNRMVQSLTRLSGRGVAEGWGPQTLWFAALAAPFARASGLEPEETALLTRLNRRPPLLRPLTNKNQGLVLAFPSQRG